jgi:hypothetical protein
VVASILQFCGALLCLVMSVIRLAQGEPDMAAIWMIACFVIHPVQTEKS